MVKEAEANASEDKKKKEEAEVRNNASSLIGSAERITKDFEGKIDSAEEAKLNEQKTRFQKHLMKINQAKKLKNFPKNYNKQCLQFLKKAYEQVQKEGEASSESASSDTSSENAGASSSDDDVIDAEYTKEN